MNYLKQLLQVLPFLFFATNYSQVGEWVPAKVILKNGQSFRGLIKIPESGFPLRPGPQNNFFDQHHNAVLESYGFEPPKDNTSYFNTHQDFNNSWPETSAFSFNTTKVYFKKKKKSPKQKFDATTLKEIVFGDEYFAVERYRFISVSKNKSVLMLLVKIGNVNLYRNGTVYYVIKDSETFATAISKKGVHNFISIINAKDYFSDCKKIVYYLENDIYNYDNIEELVDDYNLLCDQGNH